MELGKFIKAALGLFKLWRARAQTIANNDAELMAFVARAQGRESSLVVDESPASPAPGIVDQDPKKLKQWGDLD